MINFEAPREVHTCVIGSAPYKSDVVMQGLATYEIQFQANQLYEIHANSYV